MRFGAWHNYGAMSIQMRVNAGKTTTEFALGVRVNDPQFVDDEGNWVPWTDIKLYFEAEEGKRFTTDDIIEQMKEIGKNGFVLFMIYYPPHSVIRVEEVPVEDDENVS
jgi:hypothetical protein